MKQLGRLSLSRVVVLFYNEYSLSAVVLIYKENSFSGVELIYKEQDILTRYNKTSTAYTTTQTHKIQQDKIKTVATQTHEIHTCFLSLFLMSHVLAG